MNDLRDGLHRIADSATPLPVDDGLWQRGVTARRRGQAFLVAAVLAIIASVTWSTVLLGHDDREARTASQEVPRGAIPSRITDIPADLAVTTDLAVGRASAAFISGTDEPVVITAVDGVAHRLELAGWVANGTEPGDVRQNQSLALSPDGEQLAWQTTSSDDGRPAIGVLDLATGRSSSYALEPDAQLRLRELSWSPDSSWLGWIGDSSPTVFLGRLRPGSIAEGDHISLVGNIGDLTVSSDGTLVFSRASGGLYRVEGRDQPERIADVAGVGAGRFSPDARFVALRSGPSDASSTLRLSDGAVLTHPFPDGTFGAAVARPLGWMDARLQVLFVQEALGGAGADSGELVVTTPEVDDTSTWRRSVGVVEAGPATTLSLAVDLLPDLDGTSSQELTHDFPEPAERDVSWIIGLGVAAAIALLLALRWLWRRLL